MLTFPPPLPISPPPRLTPALATSGTSSSSEVLTSDDSLAFRPLKFDDPEDFVLTETGAPRKGTRVEAHLLAIQAAIGECNPTIFIRLWQIARDNDYAKYFADLVDIKLIFLSKTNGGFDKIIAFARELLEKHAFRLELDPALKRHNQKLVRSICFGGITPVRYRQFHSGYKFILGQINVLPPKLNTIIAEYCAGQFEFKFEVNWHENIVFERSNSSALRRLFEMDSSKDVLLAGFKATVLYAAYTKDYSIEDVRNLARFGSRISPLGFTESGPVQFEREQVFNLSQVNLRKIPAFFFGRDLSRTDMTYVKFPTLPNRKINFNFADLRCADFTHCDDCIFPPYCTLIGTKISASSLAHIPEDGGARKELIEDFRKRGAIVFDTGLNSEKNSDKSTASRKRKSPASSLDDCMEQ